MKTFHQTPVLNLGQANLLTLVITFLIFTLAFGQNAMAQEKIQMVRLAIIKVDPVQIDQYNTALKEQMITAIRVEPGVLTYYAVADKTDPTQITILEIYADTAAYQLHITTPHFLKYKKTVQNMVLSLQLVDVNLIAVEKKPGM